MFRRWVCRVLGHRLGFSYSHYCERCGAEVHHRNAGDALEVGAAVRAAETIGGQDGDRGTMPR